MSTNTIVAEGAIFLCLLVPVAIAIVVAIAVAANKANQRRLAEFRAVAEESGLNFDPSSRPGFDREHPRIECFQQGHSRRAFNLLSGALAPRPGAEESAQLQCIVGEYEFKVTTSNGKSTQTVTYTFGFAILITRWHVLPDMLIRHEGFFDKIAGFLGFDDIDFESAEFSRTFMVKSSDKRFAYDLIDAQMMEFLLQAQGGTVPNIDVGDSGFCLWYGQSKRLEPRELLKLLDWGREFFGRWPRVLRADLDERTGANS